MFYLKHKLILLIVALGSLLALWAVPLPAAAQGALTVTFEDSPLFSEANFLPGDAVTRWVQVQNNSGVGQVMGVKLDPYQDPDNLGSQLTVVIKEGSTVLYGPATLDDFDNDSPVTLSTVADTASTQYDFTVTFPAAAGNEYQSAAVGFDLQVGTLEQDGTFTISLTGGGGGGGGGGSPQADLALTKDVLGSLPTPGSTYSYELVVSNQGPDTATNVVVTDVLPASLTYVSSSASQGSYNVLIGQWSVGTLTNGASASLTLTVTL
ncbi:MAG: DUF11 domain-containing protein, partial [Candidatus Veblenbacteria bacterium]|nr:DUF11 domain-containing protein [Candidatus Veblenbacteria bacterium]